ncbi:hypothetical protein [Leptolyngbya sp. Cla-17]|uniref:hypothetical protein n=1 Tax=Leptolyngbya sp. Cla-17 TaxID=2803751 RepID=UPI001F5E11A7|nr:hypothetical protein [Leptolyngbya sp. Cla-17]
MFEFALLRQRTNSDRALMSAAHTRSTRRLSISGLKHRFPQMVGEAFAQKVAQSFLVIIVRLIFLQQPMK